jgi:hypothetical protein
VRVEKIGGHSIMLMEAGEIPSAARDNPKWMNFQMGNIQRGNFGRRDFSTEMFSRLAETGDEGYVAQSDKFLTEIEDQVPVSRGWRNVDDVVGAVPNVPAFLAGHPQHMRRRERVSRENAPVTIFMNLNSSMGIRSELILRRGIVLLALARLLVEHRPVELWVGSSLSDGYLTGTTAWRIDTVPLDLARAAFHISDPSMSRVFGYAMCETMVNKHLGGGGPEDRMLRELKAVAGWRDVVYIPSIGYSDPMVNDPMAWLKRTMSQYVRTEEAA